ncbi:repressor protein [Exophiala viscosa]|uniref:repressor protein n=1 Tax=Exophiala viscosa TaxID=2486360 RepID=UPI002196CB93|nr:repressor protein [Exophiala viscosa]
MDDDNEENGTHEGSQTEHPSQPISASASLPQSPDGNGAHTRQQTASSTSRIGNALPEGQVDGRLFHPDASLVLVGIRASGKRSLGFIAATALGRRFITEDHYFQSVNGLSRQDYLKIHGSEQFHRQDVKTSKRMLEDNKYGCVIDCGLGSLTSSLQDHLRQYSQTNPVVFILRDMAQIRTLLSLNDRSAKLLDNGNFTHRRCSNFEYYNLEDESMQDTSESDAEDRAAPTYSFRLKDAQADFSRFVRYITGSSHAQAIHHSPFSLDGAVELRTYTHALLVKLSNYVAEQVDFEKLESAGDVLEIYVDRWHPTMARHLSKMVAVSRRVLKLPILLSVSSTLPHSTEGRMNVLLHGLRLGVEFVSVDVQLKEETMAQLKAIKGYTKLVGTYTSGINDKGWKDPMLMTIQRNAVAIGFDIIRLIHFPTSQHDNQTLVWFMEELADLSGPRTVTSAFNVGTLGRTSQITNRGLTSVTHPALPQLQAPRLDAFQPTLSSKQIINALFDNYTFDPLQFHIVGANVTGSLSPAMHNAAYALLGLRHSYSARNIRSWADIEELSKDDNLGGLSIVQPYKVKVVPSIASLSDHARTIGAVNTVVPLRENAAGVIPPLTIQAQERNRAGNIVGWYGENTDYIGIMTCVNRSLSPRNILQPRSTALVIGAGGMARAAVYAMLQLGCKTTFVYNRTTVNAMSIATHFNEWARSQPDGHDPRAPNALVRVLESRNAPWPADFAPPTIVISCVTHEVLDGNPGADFELPESWMQSQTGGVVVEMAYMTKETPLVRQMKTFRETTKRPWVLIDGIETLIEQAIAQFETMTGRKAPKRAMAEAVHGALKENTSYLVDGEEFFT